MTSPPVRFGLISFVVDGAKFTKVELVFFDRTALAPKDHALLLAVSRGEFALSSSRNADLRAMLYHSPKPSKLTKAEIRRRSAAVTRHFALLRAHRLLRKMPGSNRYLLTSKGRKIITALLAACYGDVEQLTNVAA